MASKFSIKFNSLQNYQVIASLLVCCEFVMYPPIVKNVSEYTKEKIIIICLNQGGKRLGGETGSPLFDQCVMQRRTSTSTASVLPVQLMAAKNLLHKLEMTFSFLILKPPVTCF